MFRIAICDDEKAICVQLEEILEDIESALPEEFAVEVFFSGEELYQFILTGAYFDIIFLDIEMEGMNGIEFGEKLRKDFANEVTQIIYISGNESHAIDLFRIRPFGFIVKPLTYKKVFEMVKKVLKFLNNTNQLFEYKISHTTYRVPIKDILYFESERRKINIVLQDDLMGFYGSLSDIEGQLAKYDFIKIHNSYLVNYRHIIKFEYTRVMMSNNAILPISQSNRKRVRQTQIKLRRGY